MGDFVDNLATNGLSFYLNSGSTNKAPTAATPK